MKGTILFTLIVLQSFLANGQQDKTNPRLKKQNGCIVLWVDGHFMLLRGGELGNSSASSMEYMLPIWPKLTKMHLNTVITPVYWELLEPTEGKFDFTLVDGLIAGARKDNLKLVLLWFGTWKNSMSCYVPGWVKTDQERFPRAVSKGGISQEIITPFSASALDADKRAFVALMTHIKATDLQQHTVLMVQVENEIGMLPDARDYGPLADEAFAVPVPQGLMNYLAAHRDSLAPELKGLWEGNGSKMSGSWEEVFGKSPATDEVFMAWYFGRYVDDIARAGKAVYDIPMYVNAALNAPGKIPGQYPSAGPLPHVIDVWKAAAPYIDFLSPDFYNPNFQYWSDRYTRSDNPLFVPEHRFEPGVDAKAFYAFGHYHALGFSPFSIESTSKPEEEPIGKSYAIIQQLTGLMGGTHSNNRVDGFLLSKDSDTAHLKMGGYNITVAHDRALGWSSKSKEDTWPLTGGIIIAVSDSEFYVGGTGLVMTFTPLAEGRRAGILSVEEGQFIDGNWKPGRRMNGDQDHQGRHLRIPECEYGIQRIRLYTYQ